jgi:hypothetical protein
MPEFAVLQKSAKQLSHRFEQKSWGRFFTSATSNQDAVVISTLASTLDSNADQEDTNEKALIDYIHDAKKKIAYPLQKLRNLNIMRLLGVIYLPGLNKPIHCGII